MELSTKNLNKVYNTKQVKNLVNAWLMQKALSEVLREQVDSVYHEILQKFEVFTDAFVSEKRGGKIERIFDHSKLYLSKDEETILKIYAEADQILKDRGIKPLTMEDGFCPALTAESELRKIEHLLIEATGGPFGVTVSSLTSSGSLDNYKKWVDLSVKAVMSLPDFVNPLTGKKI